METIDYLDREYDDRLSELERGVDLRLQPIKDAVERIAEGRPKEDQELLKALYDMSDRYLFVSAWIRSKLDAGRIDDLVNGLKDMFGEGEDDFDTYAPPLAKLYEAYKEVELFYTEWKGEGE